MKTLLVLAVAMLVGCTEDALSAEDAGRPDQMFEVGSACSVESTFCAGYAGLCHDGVCRLQCSATFPACDAGTAERFPLGSGRGCVCITSDE